MNLHNHPTLLLLAVGVFLFAYGVVPHRVPGLIDRLFASDKIIAILYLISITLSPALFAFPMMGVMRLHDVPFASAAGLLAGFWMYLTQRMSTRKKEGESS